MTENTTEKPSTDASTDGPLGDNHVSSPGSGVPSPQDNHVSDAELEELGDRVAGREA